HPPHDIFRVLAALEHAGHPVERRVRVAAAQALVQRADGVVVLFSRLVIEQAATGQRPFEDLGSDEAWVEWPSLAVILGFHVSLFAGSDACATGSDGPRAVGNGASGISQPRADFQRVQREAGIASRELRDLA